MNESEEGLRFTNFQIDEEALGLQQPQFALAALTKGFRELKLGSGGGGLLKVEAIAEEVMSALRNFTSETDELAQMWDLLRKELRVAGTHSPTLKLALKAMHAMVVFQPKTLGPVRLSLMDAIIELSKVQLGTEDLELLTKCLQGLTQYGRCLNSLENKLAQLLYRWLEQPHMIDRALKCLIQIAMHDWDALIDPMGEVLLHRVCGAIARVPGQLSGSVSVEDMAQSAPQGQHSRVSQFQCETPPVSFVEAGGLEALGRGTVVPQFHWLVEGLVLFETLAARKTFPFAVMPNMLATLCLAVNVESQASLHVVHNLIEDEYYQHHTFTTLLYLISADHIKVKIFPDMEEIEICSIRRGGVYFLGVFLWGSQSLPCFRLYWSSMIRALQKVVAFYQPAVVFEVALSVERLVKKYGSELDIEWTDIFILLHQMEKLLPKPRILVPETKPNRLRSMSEGCIVNESENDQIDLFDARIHRILIQTILYVQKFVQEQSFKGDLSEFYSVIQAYITHVPEKSVRLAFEFHKKKAFPGDIDWVQRCILLLEVFFQPYNYVEIRLQVLEFMEKLLLGYPNVFEHRKELINMLALEHLNDIYNDHMAQVRAAGLKLLTDICKEFHRTSHLPRLLSVLRGALESAFYTDAQETALDGIILLFHHAFSQCCMNQVPALLHLLLQVSVDVEYLIDLRIKAVSCLARLRANWRKEFLLEQEAQPTDNAAKQVGGNIRSMKHRGISFEMHPSELINHFCVILLEQGAKDGLTFIVLQAINKMLLNRYILANIDLGYLTQFMLVMMGRRPSAQEGQSSEETYLKFSETDVTSGEDSYVAPLQRQLSFVNIDASSSPPEYFSSSSSTWASSFDRKSVVDFFYSMQSIGIGAIRKKFQQGLDILTKISSYIDVSNDIIQDILCCMLSIVPGATQTYKSLNSAEYILQPVPNGVLSNCLIRSALHGILVLCYVKPQPLNDQSAMIILRMKYLVDVVVSDLVLDFENRKPGSADDENKVNLIEVLPEVLEVLLCIAMSHEWKDSLELPQLLLLIESGINVLEYFKKNKGSRRPQILALRIIAAVMVLVTPEQKDQITKDITQKFPFFKQGKGNKQQSESELCSLLIVAKSLILSDSHLSSIDPFQFHQEEHEIMDFQSEQMMLWVCEDAIFSLKVGVGKFEGWAEILVRRCTGRTRWLMCLGVSPYSCIPEFHGLDGSPTNSKLPKYTAGVGLLGTAHDKKESFLEALIKSKEAADSYTKELSFKLQLVNSFERRELQALVTSKNEGQSFTPRSLSFGEFKSQSSSYSMEVPYANFTEDNTGKVKVKSKVLFQRIPGFSEPVSPKTSPHAQLPTSKKNSCSEIDGSPQGRDENSRRASYKSMTLPSQLCPPSAQKGQNRLRCASLPSIKLRSIPTVTNASQRSKKKQTPRSLKRMSLDEQQHHITNTIYRKYSNDSGGTKTGGRPHSLYSGLCGGMFELDMHLPKQKEAGPLSVTPTKQIKKKIMFQTRATQVDKVKLSREANKPSKDLTSDISAWLKKIGLDDWAPTIIDDLGFTRLAELMTLAGQKEDLKELIDELDQKGMKLAQRQALRREITSLNNAPGNGRAIKPRRKKRIKPPTRCKSPKGIKIPGSASSCGESEDTDQPLYIPINDVTQSLTSHNAPDAVNSSPPKWNLSFLVENILSMTCTNESLQSCPVEMKVPKEKGPSSYLSRGVELLDRMPPIETHKIALLYVGPDQTEEKGILGNNYGSIGYTTFMQGLGELYPLKELKLFAGGLDTDSGTDGEFALCWWGGQALVLFHTPLLMPEGLNARKRHVGNDLVHIVYCEEESYRNDSIGGQFGLVSIVVFPLIGLKECRIKVQTKHQECNLKCLEWEQTIPLHAAPAIVRQTAISAEIACRSLLENQISGLSNLEDRLLQIYRMQKKNP